MENGQNELVKIASLNIYIDKRNWMKSPSNVNDIFVKATANIVWIIQTLSLW